jgi:hypothetical protein
VSDGAGRSCPASYGYGPDVFRRAPVTADMVLSALEAGRRTHDVTTSHV